MTPFFSVIICTYNRASLLPRALDSLLAQTEGDWEAIVVDDGSTDDTFEVVQRYAASDARITCVQRDRRGGVAAARNAGITRSTGLFVTFLDSDDAYAEDHLETRKLMLLDRPSTQLLLGGITIIGDPYVVDRFDPTKRVHLDECVVGGTFCIRRDVFALVGGFDLVDYADDALFFDRCADADITILFTDHPSYIYYRNVPDQLTSSHGT